MRVLRQDPSNLRTIAARVVLLSLITRGQPADDPLHQMPGLLYSADCSQAPCGDREICSTANLPGHGLVVEDTMLSLDSQYT